MSAQYFNPQGPHGPRRKGLNQNKLLPGFQSTRPSRASTGKMKFCFRSRSFQSTRPSRASTVVQLKTDTRMMISIHKALTGLDRRDRLAVQSPQRFQSTRPSRASTEPGKKAAKPVIISIHKALTGLDYRSPAYTAKQCISIHKALTGLDTSFPRTDSCAHHFNPQGPHGPRHYR